MPPKDDDFQRVGDDTKSKESEPSGGDDLFGGNKSKSSAKNDDPYSLDFAALREQYVRDHTLKVPFTKSSLIHYSKCPRSMYINGRLYEDLVLTMELIQVPDCVKYHTLQDKLTKKQRDEKARARAEKLKDRRAKEARLVKKQKRIS